MYAKGPRVPMVSTKRSGPSADSATQQPLAPPCRQKVLIEWGLPAHCSPVHAVVDAVNEVRLVDGQHDELGLVLLHDGLNLIRPVGDVVDVGDLLVRAVAADEARSRRVHAWVLPVRLDVRVVQ